MTTALDIITDAAKEIGVVFKSEALSADEASDALTALNDMLDSWSNDGLVTFFDTLENFAITGASSYTMGVSGDFNTARPINILTAVIRVSSVDYPIRIVGQQEFQVAIADKTATSQIPDYLTYDNAFPLGTIKMFPIPTTGTLYLQSRKPLSNLATLTTTISLPPGWKRALKTNLGIVIAPQYGAQVSPLTLQAAKESLGMIKRAASINRPMPLMPSVIEKYNIITGP